MAEALEYEPAPAWICEKCGGEKEWVQCWTGCEDGTYDLYEEDPIFYAPGQRASCSECDGAGGWLVCPFCSAQPQGEDRGPNG